ncbi:MAG TPA: PIN domain nuclease [Geobacter sp.]|nr:PIN domain nuclease [Geobacter sp.]
MRVLLDTHIYLWWLADSPSLSRSARKIIESAETVYVSSASIWEAVIKIGLKRLDVEAEDLVSGIQESDFIELPIKAEHTLSLLQLGNYHKDPFDRILVAQAISEPVHLLSSDSVLAQYSKLVMIV